jgi:hypothetical protein
MRNLFTPAELDQITQELVQELGLETEAVTLVVQEGATYASLAQTKDEAAIRLMHYAEEHLALPSLVHDLPKLRRQPLKLLN